jgi:hypothetical protein
MKIFAVSGNKKFYRIGETFPASIWYTASEDIIAVASAMAKGDVVEIKSEPAVSGGNPLMTSIKKVGTAAPSNTSTSHASAPNSSYQKSTYGKSPEEQNNIKRLALGNMVSRSLIALQGHIDLNNIYEIIDTLYSKYEEKIG